MGQSLFFFGDIVRYFAAILLPYFCIYFLFNGSFQGYLPNIKETCFLCCSSIFYLFTRNWLWDNSRAFCVKFNEGRSWRISGYGWVSARNLNINSTKSSAAQIIRSKIPLKFEPLNISELSGIFPGFSAVLAPQICF